MPLCRVKSCRGKIWISVTFYSMGISNLTKKPPIIMTWKCCPHHWLFGRGIRQSLVISPDEGPVKLWCFLGYQPEQGAEQTVELPMIWDAIMLTRHYCNDEWAISKGISKGRDKWFHPTISLGCYYMVPASAAQVLNMFLWSYGFNFTRIVLSSFHTCIQLLITSTNAFPSVISPINLYNLTGKANRGTLLAKLTHEWKEFNTLAEIKCPLLGRQHFKIHFLVLKWLYFNSNFT